MGIVQTQFMRLFNAAQTPHFINANHQARHRKRSNYNVYKLANAQKLRRHYGRFAVYPAVTIFTDIPELDLPVLW